jgi:hypothetical protein
MTYGITSRCIKKEIITMIYDVLYLCCRDAFDFVGTVG